VDTTTITALDVRVANPPLAVPHATAGGLIGHFPVVLLDLRTAAGITGCAYVFTYTLLAAPAVARLLRDIAPLVLGQPAQPLPVQALLRKRFRLLGPHGLTAMVMAAIDMALWDVSAKAAGQPLFALLGGARQGTPGYAPIGQSGEAGVVREAEAGLAAGFEAVKAKIGYPTLAGDLAVLRTIRETIGPQRALMCDYNQALDVPEAIRRGRAIDAEPGLDIAWIEEPTLAEDFHGHARIAAAVQTPIQAGENWWSPLEFDKAIAAGATDLLMPDVMKLGGITPWLKVAALAEARSLPVSNHLFPEVSAHLQCVTPTAHWFEWADWSEPLVSEPVRVAQGRVWPSEKPGIGIEWNEAGLQRHLVAGA
jgi:mandelate racemase